MNRAPVRVLLVEDDVVDRLACRRALSAQSDLAHADYRFEVEEADTAQDGLRRAHAAAPDLILLDYHLPDMDGVEFLAALSADSGEMPVPVMMLTGADNVGVAVDAMRCGARDYLVKDGEGDYLKLLPTVIQRVLRESQAHADKREAQGQLRAAEAQYRSLVEQIPAIVYTAALDVPGQLLYVSPQIQRLGFTPEEWLSGPEAVLQRIHPDDQARVLATFARGREAAEPRRCEYRMLARDGQEHWILDEARVVYGANQEALFLQGVLIDITIDKQREAELEYHRRHLEQQVEARTAQITKQTELLRDANSNLVREIGERRIAETRLRELVEHAPDGIFVADLDGRYTDVNDAGCRLLGYQRAELVGKTILDLLAAEDHERLAQSREQLLQGATHVAEWALRRKDGSYLPVEVSAKILPDGRWQGFVRDISERRQAAERVRQSEARFRLLLESAGEGIYGLDTEGRCTFVNEAALTMLGYSRAELLGRETHGLIHHTYADGNVYPAEACSIYDAFRTGRPTRGLVELLWRKDGSSFPAEYSAQPMRENGRANGRAGEQITGAVLVFRDVTEAQALAHRLSFQATHDALTGLVNRQEFERRLERVLLERQSDGEEYALLYLDLDQFKVVNDTCGHSAGDQLLRQITLQLHESLRGRDTLARLGGDEFGVLLEHCPLDQAMRIAIDLRDAVQNHRFVWEGKPFSVGVSIGLAPLSAALGNVAGALAAADAACYAAKEQGRNRVHLYQPDDAVLAQQHTQMQWISRLTHALDVGHFRLYQQTIAPLAGRGQGRPHVEILLRLLDEDGRVVEPMAFVPAAERYNLMPAIDRWVVREVISRYAVRERAAAAAARPIYGINLSACSLSDERLAEYVRGLLAEHRVPADMLCFEITETAAIANLGRAAQFMRELGRDGCLFALDDFGSGMSSFAYLKQLPVDFLKIDGSFIRTMVEDQVTRAMAEAINRVAHVMAIETVAECAESSSILALLRELGVDHAQGYALARPQPLPEDAAPASGVA